MAGLRNRTPLLPAPCRGCRFMAVCDGNLRARACFVTSDPWGMDPARFPTDE